MYGIPEHQGGDDKYKSSKLAARCNGGCLRGRARHPLADGQLVNLLGDNETSHKIAKGQFNNLRVGVSKSCAYASNRKGNAYFAVIGRLESVLHVATGEQTDRASTCAMTY